MSPSTNHVGNHVENHGRDRRTNPVVALASEATAAALLGIAGLHLAWGAGSPFPFASRPELADAVIGSHDVPPPAACAAVAGALLAAAALVGGHPALPRRLRRLGVVGVTVTLGGRAVLGFTNATELVSPGSSSARFQRLDRRVYAPLCTALAAGAALSLAAR